MILHLKPIKLLRTYDIETCARKMNSLVDSAACVQHLGSSCLLHFSAVIKGVTFAQNNKDGSN